MTHKAKRFSIVVSRADRKPITTNDALELIQRIERGKGKRARGYEVEHVIDG